MEKKNEKEPKKEKCIFCNKIIEGYGNNPRPVKDKGLACDKCNLEIVIPARLLASRNGKKEA